MNFQVKRATLALLVFLTLFAQSSIGQELARDASKQPRNGITILVYARPQDSHDPIEVKMVSNSSAPKGSVIVLATIESFSAKPVAAVRLGWNAYKESEGMKKALLRPLAAGEDAEVFASGTTPLIPVEVLAEKEICEITADSSRRQTAGATKTVLVNQAIVSMDNIKSLRGEPMVHVFNDDYAIVVYVSEIRFVDGTEWKGTIK
jgi:hypothetical protein